MALINDILDMSKIESGKIDIKRETFDFGTFVGRSTTCSERRLSNRGFATRRKKWARCPRCSSATGFG